MPHCAMQGQWFVECDRSVVESGFADAAVEGVQASRQAWHHSTIWWTQTGPTCYSESNQDMQIILNKRS